MGLVGRFTCGSVCRFNPEISERRGKAGICQRHYSFASGISFSIEKWIMDKHKMKFWDRSPYAIWVPSRSQPSSLSATAPRLNLRHRREPRLQSNRKTFYRCLPTSQSISQFPKGHTECKDYSQAHLSDRIIPTHQTYNATCESKSLKESRRGNYSLRTHPPLQSRIHKQRCQIPTNYATVPSIDQVAYQLTNSREYKIPLRQS